ncbi:MAG: hypothetical protein U0452_08050 [Anaerolineae bacterium]
MRDTENAILRTVLYGDVFGFPMTAQEIHHFLISDTPCPAEVIETTLRHSARLARLLEQRDGWTALAGRAELMGIRAGRDTASTHLLVEARRYGRWLSLLPFVRMVAITGALAMHNAANAQDDIDYVVVTSAGRVWLARAFAIGVVRLARLRGVTVCPNYVLAESALAQDRRDLYIAHEVTQMVPLHGFTLYAQMRALNGWTAQFLANANSPFHQEAEWTPEGVSRAAKRTAEWFLSGRIGNALENWERKRKIRRFQSQMVKASAGAQLDTERVKGHFNDHGQRVIAEYEARLRAYGLAEIEPTDQSAAAD